MPTFFYNGSDLSILVLDGFSGFDVLDMQFFGVTGTTAGDFFDVSAILSYPNGNSFILQGGADTFIGSSQAEEVYGGADQDTLNGGGGADTLYGGAGADVLSGGDGDDVIYTGTDDGAIDLFDGGIGVDTVIYQGFDMDGLALGIGTSIENFDDGFFNVSGTGSANTFDMSGILAYLNGNTFFMYGGDDTFIGSDEDENVYGGSGQDTLNGGGGADTLRGGMGAEVLNGGDGDDVIYTGTNDGAIDLFDGGIGVDTVIYQGFDMDGLALGIGTSIENFDDDFFEVTGTSSANTFDLSGIQSYINGNTFDLRGGNDTFIGSELAEVVSGGSGADTLNGGGGADTLYGSTGADVLNGGDGDDVIYTGTNDGAIDLFDGGIGVDTVIYQGFDMDGLALGIGTSIENFDDGFHFVTGTSSANTFDLSGIQSYVNGNTFYLRGGNDTFIGSDKSESIEGGSGQDTLEGGRGADTFVGGNGADVLIGGKGADVFRIGLSETGIDIIQGSGGIDRVVFNGSDIEGLTLDSASSVEEFDADFFDVTGTSVANGFDLSGVTSYLGGNTFVLRGGADSFKGSDLAESISAGSGADFIETNGGKDTVVGGNGNDEIYGGNGSDSLEGGNGQDRLIGEGGNDKLIGGSGNDVLRGQNGRDKLTGGDGNDKLTGGKKADTFIFSNGWGNDTISDFSTNNSEDIKLSNVTAITDFADLIANHLRDNGGEAEIFAGSTDTILLEGIAVSDIGVGLAYSADDFIF